MDCFFCDKKNLRDDWGTAYGEYFCGDCARERAVDGVLDVTSEMFDIKNWVLREAN